MKKSIGSMPYDIVLPMKGIQWNAAGGSLFLRGRSWRMTLPMNAMAANGSNHAANMAVGVKLFQRVDGQAGARDLEDSGYYLYLVLLVLRYAGPLCSE
jgi:hypothetical protein